jgi:hypothetical protein
MPQIEGNTRRNKDVNKGRRLDSNKSEWPKGDEAGG